MSSHQHRGIERHCDVAVIGGSAAGLAAALQLGRQRRSAIVIDAGEPRNAPAAHVHGYLGREGVAPSALLAAGREEVRSYGGEVLTGQVVGVTRAGDDALRVELEGGTAVVARRVLVATGLVDELPDVAGLAAHWGRDVIHCPFCHGYEVRDQRLVQLVTHPMGLHAAALFRQLTDRLTLVVDDRVDAPDAELETYRGSGVTVVRGRAERVVDDADGKVVGVQLADGARLDADAIVVGPRFHARTEALAGLGLAATPHPSGLGDALPVEADGRTAVAGVYAAGNVTDPMQQVSAAAAQGSLVGARIAGDLAATDLQVATRTSGNQADWDHRYAGEPLWSGNPNGTLVREAGALTPGRALDVGAGEGGDALWLAEQGWQVTANDVSPDVLARLHAQAERRGLAVECLPADANARDPFGAQAYDLVTAHYASIPRTPDRRGERNLLGAVAPGGVLLVVGHDLEPMREAIDSGQGHAFDPDAYKRIDDVAELLADAAGWDVEVHEKRPRPPGAASGHHVEDVVLRARRRVG
ncbi:FAD-dependent oxidoreductase [uncultured Jatrophihabitans sp.]|uniref:FAD-dependent oxidoreductase n=1 Tax=uncultured Jatrophihabitans sp. TaxID=1610747 RepID=UPI0035CC024A